MRELIQKWVDRLLCDLGWEVNIVSDLSSDGVRGESFSTPCNRTGTIRFSPEMVALEGTACHEVCHLLIGDLQAAAEKLADQLPAGSKPLAASMINTATERTVEAMVLAFRKAYKE